MDVADRVAAAALKAERLRSLLVEGGEVVEVDGLVVALTNLAAPELNGTRVARDPDDPGQALSKARDVFRSRGHPFFGIEIEVGRHPGTETAIRDAGMVRAESWPAMAVATEDVDDRPLPEGVEFRRVEDPSDLAAVRAVEVEVFGTPPAVAARFVAPAMVADPRVEIFTAWVDGVPVGEATGYLLDRSVGIFGVGVRETARRRGIGAALTLRALRAFADRADLAWLQPSDMARALYAGLGFETVSRWEVWIAP